MVRDMAANGGFVEAEDYAQALAIMDRMETLLGVYQAAKVALEQQKAAYKAPYWAAELRKALDTVLREAAIAL